MAMNQGEREAQAERPEESERTPQAAGPQGAEPQTMVRLAAVRLRPGLPPAHFDAGELQLREGEWVVVETDHGLEVGQTVGRVVPIPLALSLPRVLRIASTEEIKGYGANLEREKEAWRICQELIGDHGLEMKLVRVESFFDGSKIVFYYSAEGRVDFRALVKDLVRALHTRIEMRQIGIRHEAKMVGGIGSCGRAICCAGFMKGFAPVSIKMAKTQNLPLNPNKISGLCGRLLCCITYEYASYADGTMAQWAKEAAEAAEAQAREQEEALAKGPVFPELGPGGEEREEGAGHGNGDPSGAADGAQGRRRRRRPQRRSGRRRRPKREQAQVQAQGGRSGEADTGEGSGAQGPRQQKKGRRRRRRREEKGNGDGE